MSIPTEITAQIYDHYQAADWCLITLDQTNRIIKINRKAIEDLNIPEHSKDLQEVLPLVATEPLNQSFFLPFYNHGNKVYDVHFITSNAVKYLILVPIDLLHNQVQIKQQIAHEEEIAKLRAQQLLDALESAHAELNEANAAKSFYISALSHEMGNPLNAIKGYNDLLAEAAISTKQASTVIKKNVEKLQHIINQTLDYDNQQSKKNTPAFKVSELITDIFNDFKPQASRKSLELRNEVDQDIALNCNKTKLNQIITNLVSNAIKYTEQGEITVKSTTEHALLYLDVIDTGCGISPAFQKKMFTAWTREQKSHEAGNGIGLVIAKMMAEQICANLCLYSSGPTGSTFRLSMDYAQAKEQIILLVDDDVDCLNLFNFYLSQAGHQVVTAHSIQDMLAQLQSHQFDAIITDLNLSDGQADQVFDHIKESVQLKVVMTANPNTETIAYLSGLGFDKVLCKPLNQEDLVNSVS